LFESGAIVLHIAQTMTSAPHRRQCASPRNLVDVRRSQHDRARLVQREVSILIEKDKAWHEERLPLVMGRIRDRLDDLSARLATPIGSTAISAPAT
jgi:glutathione S-transferase